MQAYFDIENLSSFTKSSAKAQFDDCNRMLRGHFDLKFNFTKKDLEEKAKENPAILSWLTTMTQGFKGSISYSQGEPFPPHPLKSNTHKSFDLEQLMSIYLINDPRIAKIKENGCIMYAPIGEEVEVLSSLFKDSDYQFQKSFELRKMTGWSDLDGLITPTSDIIIADQYCLSDPNVYENNIYTLLSVLCQKVNNVMTNIIIFTQPSNYDRVNKYTFEPDWANIRAAIKRKVKSTTGMEPKVTFVLASDMGEHDRTVFTNYQYLVPGDTINLFDSQWRVISHGRHLGVYSLAHRDHPQAMRNFIADMQAIIDKIKTRNPEQIKFDKESLFLNF